MLNSKHKKEQKQKKNVDKYGKALCKSMNNTVYGKSMENLKNRINVKLVSNIKDYFKPSFMLHKIFDNDLVVIHKNKFT